MAQQLNDDDVKQPGDQQTDEGAVTSSPLYPNHKFAVDEESNSLAVTIQNKKTKRVYSGRFNKSKLESMKLHGSVSKVIRMINTAKSGKSGVYKFKFNLLFGNADNDKISRDQMTNSYSKGCCMFMIISVDEFFMSGIWTFKLCEQKREETDINRDMIEDLQDEIAELKKKLNVLKMKSNMNPIAVWKSSKSFGGQNIQWDVEHIAPTVNDLAKREDNNQTIVIGIAGLYKVSIRFGWNSSSGASYQHYLKLNGTTVATSRQYYDIQFTITEILKLAKGDKLVFNNAGSAKNWDQTFNSFSLEILDYTSNI